MDGLLVLVALPVAPERAGVRVISRGSQVLVMGFQSLGTWLVDSMIVGMSAADCAPDMHVR